MTENFIKMDTNTPPTYEAALKRLEELVSRLERGDLSLEESIAAYEEGKKLASFCAQKLKEAQNRVQVLLEKEDGTLELSPFVPNK